VLQEEGQQAAILRSRVVPPIVLHEVSPIKFEVLDSKQPITAILSLAALDQRAARARPAGG
jgi:hypothetical protein